MRRKNGTATRKKVLTLIFALAFLLSGGMLLHDLCRSARERGANEALVQLVEQPAPPARSGAESEEETPQAPLNCSKLCGQYKKAPW